MNITFNTQFTNAINQLAHEQDMSTEAIVKQAVRLYQLVHERRKAGETFGFSGDANRAAEFKGLAALGEV